MAKRQATYQIGKDDLGDEGEIDVDSSSFNSNPEEIAKRPIKGLPKRGGGGNAPSPQKSADAKSSISVFGESPFGKSSGPSLFPPSNTAPQQSPSFSFQPPSKSNTTASPAPSFPSFRLPGHKPAAADTPTSNKEDDNLFKFYSSMRGLNQSLLAVLQAETAKDPFSDLENVLNVALKNYSRHVKTIKAAQVATIATTNPTPIIAPSPPAGGFLFAGKSLPTSGTSTPTLNTEPAAFIPLTSSSAFPAFIPPGSGAKATSEDKSPADGGESTDKRKDTQPTAAALPSSFDSAGKTAAIPDTQMDESSFGKSKELSQKTLESTTKVSPFKPSVFGSSAFGTPSAFGGPPTLTFGASATDNDKGGEKLFGAPKSAFGTSVFGSPATTAFGDLPTSGSIGNPVGFSFGSSMVGAKEDTASTAKAEGTPTAPATTGPAVSAFGGTTSSSSNTKPVFGASAFAAPAKSVFGSNSGTSLFGGAGAFGSSSTAKLSEDSPTPTTFGSTSGFGGFGAGPSVFGAQPTPAPAAPEPSGESQETPPAAFEFASNDIEGAGEEEETAVYTVRGKLLKLVEGKWVPLGLGYFKIKKHKETGKQRVLFRTEGNGHVVANFNIFAGMALTKQAKLLRFPGMEGSQLVPLGLQLKLPAMVDETYDALSKASSEVKST